MDNKDKCFELILNYACNANCLFCSQESDLKVKQNLNLDFGEIVKKIKKARNEGYTKIGFTGGEPLLRGDIVQIVKIAKKIGFKYIRIQTNGFLLEKRDLVKSLVNNGVSYFKISVHSHRGDVSDLLMGRSKSLKKILKAINNINEFNARLSISVVINKYNYKSLYSYIKFFLERKKVSEFVFIFPLYIANMKKNIKNLAIPYEKVMPFLEKAYTYLEKNGVEDFLFLNFPPCFFPDKIEKVIGLSKFNTYVTSTMGDWDLDVVSNNDSILVQTCEKCIYNKQCVGINKNYIKIFGIPKLRPILKSKKQKVKKEKQVRNFYSTSEKCLLKILKIKKRISTDEILELSKGIPLCQNCDNSNAVMNAGESLIERGVIKRVFEKGEYYWFL